MTLIPEQRRKEIGRWGSDCQDFGITCCVYLNHLLDWADQDPAVPITRAELRAFIHEHEILEAVADLSNGTKHAELDGKPWSAAGVTLARSLSLSGSRDRSGAMLTKALHTVMIGEQKQPPLDVIDAAIARWDALFVDLGIGVRTGRAS